MNAASPSTRDTLPDYAGDSIVGLMGTLARRLGAHATGLAALRGDTAAALERAGRRIVLIVVDGLGYGYLTQVQQASALCGSLRGRITSVFPSTTASAITSLLTGLPPARHGLTGWHMYFEEADAIGAVLPFQARGSDELLTRRGLDPAGVFGHRSLFEHLPVPSHVVSPHWIVNSIFNLAHSGTAQRHGYASLTELFELIERCVRTSGQGMFVYAYWPELDSLAHEHGVESRQVAESFRRIDAGFARLLTALAGSQTTIVATGDHGLIDAAARDRIELDDHPALAAMLARPLCGERRVAYCYVRPGVREAFEDYVNERFGDRVALHDSARLVREGWFGPGPPHPRLASRIGDCVLVVRGRATIKDWLPGEKRYRQIGVHGGVSAEEMLVPLVVADC
jgi:hypothetical protein